MDRELKSQLLQRQTQNDLKRQLKKALFIYDTSKYNHGDGADKSGRVPLADFMSVMQLLKFEWLDQVK